MPLDQLLDSLPPGMLSGEGDFPTPTHSDTEEETAMEVDEGGDPTPARCVLIFLAILCANINV